MTTRRDFLKQALIFGAASMIPVAVIERAVAALTDAQIAAGVPANTFAAMLAQYLPDELLAEEVRKTNALIGAMLANDEWKGGTLHSPLLTSSDHQKPDVPCPKCSMTVKAYGVCEPCLSSMAPFKKGDIIKPIFKSRFDADHWRYIVVHAKKDHLSVLDFHNNIGWIAREQVPEMEIVKDETMSEDFYVEVMAGKHDDRF